MTQVGDLIFVNYYKEPGYYSTQQETRGMRIYPLQTERCEVITLCAEYAADTFCEGNSCAFNAWLDSTFPFGTGSGSWLCQIYDQGNTDTSVFSVSDPAITQMYAFTSEGRPVPPNCLTVDFDGRAWEQYYDGSGFADSRDAVDVRGTDWGPSTPYCDVAQACAAWTDSFASGEDDGSFDILLYGDHWYCLSFAHSNRDPGVFSYTDRVAKAYGYTL